jgi:hypothetical protein
VGRTRRSVAPEVDISGTVKKMRATKDTDASEQSSVAEQ